MPSIVRVVAQQGEVLLDKGGNGAETTEPLRPGAVLAVHDELSTNHGSLTLATPNGATLRLSGDGLMVLLSATAVYLARGELKVTAGPVPAAHSGSSGSGPEPGLPTVAVATPCGRSSVKAQDARFRIDGAATVVSVYSGMVLLGGSSPGGVTVGSGQSGRCLKGQPSQSPRPLLPAPLWTGGPELLLGGERSAPTRLTLRWQAVAAAQRYLIELFSGEGEDAVPVGSTPAAGTSVELDLREREVGTYAARIRAVDENGAQGQDSLPQSIVLARVDSLGADGTVRTAAGKLPRISAPRGMTWSVLLDGSPPAPDGLTGGAHKLRFLIAGLGAELPLVIAADKAPPPSRPSDFQGDSTAVWIGPSTDSPETAPAPAVATETPAAAKPIAAVRTPPKTQRASADSEPPGPEDVLLGGVGEVPFDGIRSPWAGSQLGGRAESTISGALRVVVAGRLAMRNGFGVEVAVNLLRAALANLPPGQESVGFGNIHAGVRTPALRSRHLALQGVAGVVVPLSTSFLDRSLEQDQQYVNQTDGSTVLRPDVRPGGGGWRVEPALLLGVRYNRFFLSTMQGLSLRITPDVATAYVGGLMLHAELLPGLRFITFASWQVNYLGVAASPAGSLPDVGGATGWGLEILVPQNRGGNLRLAVLGRIGLGDGGIAIYGRGALGLQFGYLFK